MSEIEGESAKTILRVTSGPKKEQRLGDGISKFRLALQQSKKISTRRTDK